MFAAQPALAESPEGIILYSVEGEFDVVAQDIEDAIINRGYVVDYVAHVGEMLNRTAEDVGATVKVYSDAEVFQFCSAVVSRKAMEADPVNIAFCPYSIFVYERADEPGMVYAGYKLLQGGNADGSQEALDAVNALLDDLVHEGTGVE
ncbi:MAG: DUF302 domain-containing protein [Hyphomicrobiales bacterium]|nr:MAG: DUF302 domain-containing protein [Hyphomicrobiales bacterium]